MPFFQTRKKIDILGIELTYYLKNMTLITQIDYTNQ